MPGCKNIGRTNLSPSERGDWRDASSHNIQRNAANNPRHQNQYLKFWLEAHLAVQFGTHGLPLLNPVHLYALVADRVSSFG